MDEGKVVTIPDSTGKAIRNWTLTNLPQPDGTVITAYVQVTGVVDKDGYAADVQMNNVRSILSNILTEVQGLRQLVANATGIVSL